MLWPDIIEHIDDEGQKIPRKKHCNNHLTNKKKLAIYHFQGSYINRKTPTPFRTSCSHSVYTTTFKGKDR